MIRLIVSLVFLAGMAAQSVPDTLSAESFRRAMEDFSEEDGNFQREWMSNEDSLQSVLPRLEQTTKAGGVYLGVGHEQNFTYIAATKPAIAFIFDIRRRNLTDQLTYKALFELSSDRAEFLGRLLSKTGPPGLDGQSTVDALFAAYAAVQPDPTLLESNLTAVLTRLSKDQGIPLNDRDRREIRDFLTLFFNSGPAVQNTARWQAGGPVIPTYTDLMIARDSNGQQRSYLASEENFQFIRDMHKRNLIVPVVGNFAGKKALRSVGNFLKERNAFVSVFYLSNVEQYLEAAQSFSEFCNNVAELPIDSGSMFVRSVTTPVDRRFGSTVSNQQTFFRSVMAPIGETLAAFREGKLTYRDAIGMSR